RGGDAPAHQGRLGLPAGDDRDQLARVVDYRPATIAGVDCRLGFDDPGRANRPGAVAPLLAVDLPHGAGRVHPQGVAGVRVAEGVHAVAGSWLALRQLDSGDPLRGLLPQPDDGQVALAVGVDYLGSEALRVLPVVGPLGHRPPVLAVGREDDLDLLVRGDHVLVGYQEPLFEVDHPAGAGAVRGED